MLQNFKLWYTGEQLELPDKATYLDPRFKALSFLPEGEKIATVCNVEMEVSDMYDDIEQ